MLCFTDLPSAPKYLKVDDIARDAITLKWSLPDDTGGVPLTSYIIEQQEGNSPRWNIVAYCHPSRNWYTVFNLIQGYKYRFRVRAENPDGAGPAIALANPVTPRPLIGKTSP